MALLEVNGLTTRFELEHGPVTAVDNVSFSLDAGEILGIVGESGSGKSVTAFSLMNLLDAPGRVTGGTVRFKGQDLRAARRASGRRCAATASRWCSRTR